MEGVGEVVEVMAAEQGSGGGPVVGGGGARLGGRRLKARRDLLGGDGGVPGPGWRRPSRCRRP